MESGNRFLIRPRGGNSLISPDLENRGIQDHCEAQSTPIAFHTYLVFSKMNLPLQFKQEWPGAQDFLKCLVQENSHTLNRSGIEANVGLITRAFAPLGFQARRIPSEHQHFASHLFLDNHASGPAILMVSHLDTVFTSEEQQNGFDGFGNIDGYLVGPGMIDVKGGTVMMWLLMQMVSKMPEFLQHDPRWILAWNSSEEELTPDFADKALQEIPRSTKACLVFEADSRRQTGHEVVVARKGLARWRIEVHGRGAHSGIAHAQGLNAITRMAQILGTLDTITDYEKALTLNVGIIGGGTSTNRVPESASAEFEVRYHDLADYDEVRARLLSWNNKGNFDGPLSSRRCEVIVQPTSEIHSWIGGDGTDMLAQIWQEAGSECGMTVTTGSRGGLSDANYLGPHLPTLDGLGPRGGNAHTMEKTAQGFRIAEYVEVDSFLSKGLINLLALKKLVTLDLTVAEAVSPVSRSTCIDL